MTGANVLECVFVSQPPGKQVDGPVQQFVIRDTNILEVGEDMANKGQLLQGRLNGEKHGVEGESEIPERKPLPFKRNAQRGHTQQPVLPVPELAPATPKSAPAVPTLGEEVHLDASQPPKVPAAPDQIKSSSAKDLPGSGTEHEKKGHVLWNKHFESPGKDNWKMRTKEEAVSKPGNKAKFTGKGKELGENKEKATGSGKQPGEPKERHVETEKVLAELKVEQGEMEEELSRKGGKRKQESPVAEMKEKPEEIKEVFAGENKEELGESTDSDKVRLMLNSVLWAHFLGFQLYIPLLGKGFILHPWWFYLVQSTLHVSWTRPPKDS